MMSIQDTRCPRCGWRAESASMEPKPIVDNNGVPLCSWKCPAHVKGKSGYAPDICKLGERLVETMCEPAVRAMMEELEYLREHHDECHQPAANYDLLLAMLDGEPTNHGDCRVYAEIERLRGIVHKLPRTADGVPVVPGMPVWYYWGQRKEIRMFRVSDVCDSFLRHYGKHGPGGEHADVCYSTIEAAEAARKDGG